MPRIVKGANELNKGLASVTSPRVKPKYVRMPSSPFKMISSHIYFFKGALLSVIDMSCTSFRGAEFMFMHSNYLLK